VEADLRTPPDEQARNGIPPVVVLVDEALRVSRPGAAGILARDKGEESVSCNKMREHMKNNLLTDCLL